MGLLDSLLGAAPYVAPVLERARLRDRQKIDDETKRAFAQQAQARQTRQDALTEMIGTANADHLRAQTQSLLQPKPKTPQHVFAQDGTPYIIHEDGSFEKARIRGELPDVPKVSSSTIPDVGFKPQATPATPTQQAPTQQAAPPQAPAPAGPKFGKAPIVPRIDANSPAGIAADSAKAANRALYRAPAKIDANSAQGISADSTKAVNRAAVRPVGGGGMGGGMGSGGIGGIARTSAAITGMETAHNQMVPYENAIKTGTAKYDGLDYWMGLRGKMYDAKGVIDEAAHSAAFSNLDRNNPALSNYLRSAETWALEDSQLSGKASDFRTKMDAFISAIGPSAGATHIDNTQTFRSTRLAELKKFQPAMQKMADRIINTTGGPAPKPATNGPTGNIDLNSADKPAATPGTHTVTINGKTYRVPD